MQALELCQGRGIWLSLAQETVTLRGYGVLWAASRDGAPSTSQQAGVCEGRQAGRRGSNTGSTGAELRHTVGQNLQLAIHFRKAAHI